MKNKRVFWLFLFGGLFFVFKFLTGVTQKASKSDKVLVKTIAVLQFVEHPALDRTLEGIRAGVAKYAEGTTIQWKISNAQGNVSLAAQIAQKFIGTKPDVVVTLGTPATLPFVNLAEKYQLPVIFASVTDPLVTGLTSNLKSPNRFITGVSNFVAVEPQIELIQAIIPNLKQLGIVYNPGEANSIRLNAEIEKVCRTKGIECLFACANRSVEIPDAVRKLINEVDAFFVSNDNTVLSGLSSLLQVANLYKKPVFVSDTDIVAQGAIGALGPNQYALGVQAGEMVVQCLEGKKISDMPVEFPKETELYLNLSAAKKINLNLPPPLLESANYCL